MTRPCVRALPALGLAAAAAGCGDGSGPGSVPVVCDESQPTALSPGQLALADPSVTACLRLEAAGAGGAEYLYVAYSAAGGETREGTTAAYRLAGGPVPAPVPLEGAGNRPAMAHVPPAHRLHDRLRALGQDLARRRTGRGPSGSVAAVTAEPPVLGGARTFNVLRSADVSGLDPGDFVRVTSTARYVGTHAAIFLDDAAPAEGGYTQEDLDAIGSLFDDHLHPIDVNAFGAETDVNGDGMVLVLLTGRVTRLAECEDGQYVVGLFFAVDLLLGQAGSNNAEIFYGLVPDEECGVDRSEAVNAYNYLAQIDSAYLIGPRRPPLPLTQYGATWLFVRWLADHFAEDATLGGDLTRMLVQSTRTGADNVAQVTGTPFDRLLGEWHLANYLEDHPGFGDLAAGSRFEYTSWNLREIFASFSFASLYPLEPEVFTGGDYAHVGVLHAGSGRHLLIQQPASAGAVDLRLSGVDGTSALSPDVVPRTIVLRLR